MEKEGKWSARQISARQISKFTSVDVNFHGIDAHLDAAGIRTNSYPFRLSGFEQQCTRRLVQVDDPKHIGHKVRQQVRCFQLRNTGTQIRNTSIREDDVEVLNTFVGGEVADRRRGISLHRGVDLDDNEAAARALGADLRKRLGRRVRRVADGCDYRVVRFGEAVIVFLLAWSGDIVFPSVLGKWPQLLTHGGCRRTVSDVYAH